MTAIAMILGRQARFTFKMKSEPVSEPIPELNIKKPISCELTGSLFILKVKRAWRPKIIAIAVILICFALFSLSQATFFLWAAASLTSLALGVSSLISLANTVVQERSPEEIRGRVAAVAGLSFFGLLPFAGMIMAGLADWFGIRQALFYSACCYAVIGLFVLWWVGDAAGEELLPDLR